MESSAHQSDLDLFLKELTYKEDEKSIETLISKLESKCIKWINSKNKAGSFSALHYRTTLEINEKSSAVCKLLPFGSYKILGKLSGDLDLICIAPSYVSGEEF